MIGSTGARYTKELTVARSFAWVDETRRDLQYATRMIVRNPGFTLLIVLTIGLAAMGGTGAVFSLLNTILLKPLPYRDPAGVVVIGEGNARGDVEARFLEPRSCCNESESEYFPSPIGKTPFESPNARPGPWSS